MKHLAYCLTYLIIVTLTAGCGHNATLDRAESLLESRPDSALAILNDINTDKLSGKKENALYALLLSTARYRCGEEADDDSLLNAARRYFDINGTTRHRMLARFIYGVNLYNNGKFHEAANDLFMASHLERTDTSSFLRARINFWLALALLRQYDFNGSIRAAETAYNEYEKADSINEMLEMLWVTADCYNNLEISSKRDSTLNQAIRLYDNRKDSMPGFMVNIRNQNVAYFQYYSGRMDLCADSIIKFYGNSLPSSLQYHNGVANAYSYKGVNDSVDKYLNSAIGQMSSATDSCAVYTVISKIETRRGNLSKALAAKDTADICFGRHMTNVIFNSSEEQHKQRITNQNNELQLQIIRKQKANIILSFSIAILVMMTAIFFYVMHVRRQKKYDEFQNTVLKLRLNIADIENKSKIKDARLAELQSLVSKSTQGNNAPDETQIIVPGLGSDMKNINNLCVLLSAFTDSSKARDALYKEWTGKLEALKERKALNALRRQINTSKENIIDRLETDGLLKKEDYPLVIISLSGLSSNVAAYVLGINVNHIRVKKNRIKTRILSADTPNSEIYSRYFH